jgi:Domain of unknown function (DUF4249)
MRRILYLTLCLLGLLNLTTCLDEIELKGQQFNTKATVIQGKLVLGTNVSTVEVIVTRLGEFEGQELNSFIGNATVKLLDAEGKALAVPETPNRRAYRVVLPNNNPNYSIQVGKPYRLQVLLADGRLYESEPEILTAVSDLEGVTYQQAVLPVVNRQGFVNQDTFFQFSANTKLKAEGARDNSRLRWEVYAVYRLSDMNRRICFNTETMRQERVFLFDGLNSDIDRLDNYPLIDIRKDHRFAEGCFLFFIQETLSDEAYRYWNSVKSLAQRNGNMFDPPAGTIGTNIRNVKDASDRAFGFFYATAHDSIRLHIRPKDAGFPRRYCPQPPTDRIGPTICDDCRLQTGSSLIRPSYWVE